MINKLATYALCVAAIVNIPLLALAAWQHTQNKHLHQQVAQSQQQAQNAQATIAQMQQNQIQLQNQLNQWQQAAAQSRQQLDIALQQNPQWASQPLPSHIKKALQP
ncbi:hypothetical protein QG083_07305 [Kingella kingae]|uniref:hypothetical protein n=1 Tax=Kingella kingae TaxID=504 RepID=UPI000258500F|nr:hypothetical protein [Kingella kingae]EIC14281.1 hypothetical protein KKB_01770 [Kingella kingae PYKK081]MBD3614833.1 hypothetical protein [Kingella kingae]MBD3633188.1 hypothetical protein [Kingella kingae]MBD3660499.1 hypothetical protein [Kingella kingae]MDK4564971.1 hypothetical protein [Kingella kingae]